MDDEGWLPIQHVCNLRRLRELNTTMGDIRLIVNGGGDANNKLQFELSRWERCIRSAQGRSSVAVFAPMSYQSRPI